MVLLVWVHGCSMQYKGCDRFEDRTKNKKLLVYQQGMQGAKFRTLGHMECIRLKKKILVYQQRLQGAKFGSLGQLECIRLGKRMVPITSKHPGRLKMSYHTLEKSSCKELPM